MEMARHAADRALQCTSLQASLESELQRRLNRLGDEFLAGRDYLERDGLAHYQEVNWECRQPWTDPWRSH